MTESMYDSLIIASAMFVLAVLAFAAGYACAIYSNREYTRGARSMLQNYDQGLQLYSQLLYTQSNLNQASNPQLGEKTFDFNVNDYRPLNDEDEARLEYERSAARNAQYASQLQAQSELG